MRCSSTESGLGAGGFGDGFGDFEGVAFDDEIEVADAEAGEHIAHGAAGQEEIDVRLTGRRLDILHHPVLVRTQVALQHVDVVAHRALASSGRPRVRGSAPGRSGAGVVLRYGFP